MNNTINSDLIRGNIDTIILRALYGGDRYGYDIIKEIEQRSSGKYKLKQPTLYSCLNRLENQGFIRSYWGTKSIGGRRKYYTLTDMGKELFIKNRTDWEYSKVLIDNLITDSDDFEGDSRPIIDSSDDSLFFANIEEADDGNERRDDAEEDNEPYLAADEAEEDNEPYLAADEAEENNEPYLAADSQTEEQQFTAGSIVKKDDYITDNRNNQTDVFATDGSETDAPYSALNTDGGIKNEEVESIEYAELDEREYEREVENLFRNSGSSNYTDKLKSEQYSPDKNIYMEEHLRTDNYFKDFEDMEDFEDDEEEEEAADEIIMPQNVPVREERVDEKKSATSAFVSYKTGAKAVRSTGEFRPREEIFDIFERKLAGLNTGGEIEEEPSKTQKNIYEIFEKKLAGKKKSEELEEVPPKAQKDIYEIFERKLAGLKGQSVPQEEEGRKEKKDIYKIFEDKLAGIQKKQEREVENVYVATISEEDVATKEDPEFFRKDQIQIRNFKRLQESAANMGEEIKIRSYENSAAREFNEQYYFYSNKLKLRQYFILFCAILVEVIICYIAVNLGLHKSLAMSSKDMLIYILAVVFGLAFPSIAFALNWTNPNKRKRVSYSFSMQMLFGIIVMIQLMLIVYFTNVYYGMPLSVDSAHYNSLIVPLVLCLNVPINTVIFNILFKSKKFSV